jgi:hypothetical protein
MSVIANTATNRFGYALDDHPNTVSSGDALVVNGLGLSGYGVIEKISDADVFSFTTGTGAVSFTVNSAQYGGMLDLKLSLYDSNGNVVATANNQMLGETLNVTVSAGSYKLVVASNGNYGDVGQYSIAGIVVAVPSPVTLRLAGDANGDGKVDSFDLNVLAANWLSTSGTWATGDFNGDGKVDSLDLNVVAANWTTAAAASIDTTAVAATSTVTSNMAAAPSTELASLDPVTGTGHQGPKRKHL